MKASVNVGLQGSFKVDFYSGANRTPVSGTEYFSNFITPVGLLYPRYFAFADCMRFLSIGSSSAANEQTVSLTSSGTTGLTSPIMTYTTNVGGENYLSSGQYMGWRSYATGAEGSESSCGTIVSEDGIRLFRGWVIPDSGLINEAGGGLSINEFMVTPSTGTIDQGITGGGLAFSRVTRSIYIPNGMSVTVSYQLRLRMTNTGQTIFNSGTFLTGSANVSDGDLALVRGWNNLSGYYRQVFPSFRFIDIAGITYLPKYGDGFEPKTRYPERLVFYLSPDNAAFAVSNSGINGGNEDDAYAADGLRRYIRELNIDNAISQQDIFDPNHLDELYLDTTPDIINFPTVSSPWSNIRLGSESSPFKSPFLGDYSANPLSNGLPNDFNYQTTQNARTYPISIATPGINGWSEFYSDYKQRAVFSSSSIILPWVTGGLNSITGRVKTQTRRSTFPPFQSLGYNTRFGAMVYAYKKDNSEAGQRTYWPMIDTLFFDSSGRSIPQHYRFITGLYFTSRGSGLCAAYVGLAAVSGENIHKFISYPCYFGPPTDNYADHGIQHILVGSKPTGALMLGPSGGGYGATGLFTGSGVTGYGFGEVYGILPANPTVWWNNTTTAPDLGIADHTRSTRIKPDKTGAIYWPYVAPHGKQIKLIVSGLKYYDSYIFRSDGVVDDPLQLFTTGNPILSHVALVPVIPPTWGVMASTVGWYSDAFNGRFLATTGRYNNQPLFANDGVTVSFPLATATGHMIESAAIGTSLHGTVWSGGALPVVSSREQFTITLTGTPVSTYGSDGSTCRLVVNDFPTGLANRRGLLRGLGYPASTAWYFAFSGMKPGTVQPLFLTAISGFGTSWTGYSYMSGVVGMSQFAPPTGHPYHTEAASTTIDGRAYRLLPNYSSGNYYGTDVYSPTMGGELPALSMDNGLDVYLDLTWQADCGAGVIGC